MNFTADIGSKHLRSDSSLLFYKQRYATIHEYQHLHVFKAKEGDKTIALILFEQRGLIARSLPSSPFGGLRLEGRMPISQVSKFMLFIINYFESYDLKALEIVQPSNIYDHTLSNAPFDRFQELHQDLNQHLDLTADFDSLLHPMQKRKLKTAHRSGITCRLEINADLVEVHEFIAQCRKQNGLQINIPINKLKQLFSSFPGAYAIFSAFRGDERLATAITCKVTQDIAYYYLPATEQRFKTESPMVPLLKHIADYYRSDGIKILDLGISSVDGKKQEGLFGFKARMGAQVSYKPTYRLDL